MRNIYTKSMAYGKIQGSSEYPNLHGYVTFKQKNNGIVVIAEVFGLPYKECTEEIFGFHIHEGTSCTGNLEDEFADTKSHYNKESCTHPYHTGDMPPLFATNKGYAYMSFFTNKFTLNDIIGKTIVIHSNPDDFKTQPSGNSGTKIACGVIMY